LFGTWESDREAASDDAAAVDREVNAFIAELNAAFPSLDLKRDDVALVHRGVVPAVKRGNGIAPRAHEQFVDHSAQGIEGLVTVAGTKYTTARAVADRVTTRVVAKLGRPAVPSRTALVPLPGGGLRDVGLTIADARREHDTGLPSDTIPHLI